MKNKITFSIVLICVLVCTFILFNLIFDEHSKLFYINVTTACITEIILLSNISLLFTERLLTFKNAATFIVLDSYAVVMLIWTIIYSLFITDNTNLKVLYIGMLLITVFFLVAFCVVELGGNIMQNNELKQKQIVEFKNGYMLSLNNCWLEIQKKLLPFNSNWKENTLRELKHILDQISTIPTEKLIKNETIQSEIDQQLREIKEVLFHLPENNDECEEKQNHITLKIEQFKNYINNIKLSI